jgi:hypothetical protein
MSTTLEVPVYGGSRMTVDTSDLIGQVLAVSGVWEPHITAAFRELLASGDVCVDVGAHIGYFSLLASRLVGPHGHVYALEPAPATYAALRSNLELNGVTNVTALRVAAGDREREGLLHEDRPGNTGASSILPRPQRTRDARFRRRRQSRRGA